MDGVNMTFVENAHQMWDRILSNGWGCIRGIRVSTFLSTGAHVAASLHT